MKRKLIILMILPVLLSIQVRAQDISQVDSRKFIQQILKIYSPEHGMILDGYYSMPKKVKLPNVEITVEEPKDFMRFFSDTTRMELVLSDMPLMIHEISKDFAHRVVLQHLAIQKIELRPEDRYLLYYLSSAEHVLLKQRKTAPAKVIAELVPPHLHGPIFQKYINTSSQIGTQRNGIYGLLDEWAAYYHVSKVAFNMKGIYERKSKDSLKDWEHFFANYYDYNQYYWTFKYYVLLHLEYIRAHDLKTYKKLLEDDNFNKAIRMIDREYHQIVKDFNRYKPLIIKTLTKYQESVIEKEIDGKSILFFNDVGIFTHKNLIKALFVEIQKRELQKIQADFGM